MMAIGLFSRWPLGDTELSTEWLVSEAQAGDRSALDALFARYLPRVRRLVAIRHGYRLGDFLAFEDLVQDALLNVFLNLGKFEERAEARFCNWLAVCVANTLKEHFRRGRARKRAPALPFVPFADGLAESVLAGDDRSPSLLIEGAELAERIEDVLLQMKDEQREAIVLARLCGMSHEEIAQTLGLPTPTAARKLLSRALAVLREGLEE